MEPISDGPPPAKKPRPEPLPDVPLETSKVPFVRAAIVKNNAEKKPKLRMKPSELINATLVEAAEKELGETIIDIANEVLGNSTVCGVTLRGSTLARVLYICSSKPALADVGASLVRRLVARDFGAHHTSAIDEKVVAVAARYCSSSSGIDPRAVLGLLPGDLLRRRVFSALFQTAKENRDCALALELMRYGTDVGIEFWDEDFLKILECADGAWNVDLATRVAELMEMEHPVVGKRNFDIFAKLFCGEQATIDSDGVCSACAAKLTRFDLTEDERAVLLRDVTEKLIIPRCQCISHYEPNVPASPTVVSGRSAEFDAFVNKLKSHDYTAVIDGANVGYYGLSSWYPAAKKEMLARQSIDLSTISDTELRTIPFPVDVPPKFSLVDQMLSRVVAMGHRPLLLLHERHTREMPHSDPLNNRFLKQWVERGVLLPTPSFLNDDFCWLYACALRRGCFVVTNDLMRDHHFSLLSQRAFLRWRQQYRITYKCLFNPADASVALSLQPPKSYSVWVQRSAAGRWHIPALLSAQVLLQATNGTTRTVDYSIGKAGDDECSAWLCAPSSCTLNR